MLQGILIVVAFLVVAALMMTKKIPTLLALPLMAVVICIIAGVPMFGKNADGAEIGWLTTVFEAGTVRMGSAIMATIFGAWLGQLMNKTGVTENIIKKSAELGGDRPLVVTLIMVVATAVLFTTLSGLGSIIMVGSIVLPILISVGVPAASAACIFLMAFTTGLACNIANWKSFASIFSLDIADIQGFEIYLMAATAIATLIMVIVEFKRNGIKFAFSAPVDNTKPTKQLTGVRGGYGHRIVCARSNLQKDCRKSYSGKACLCYYQLCKSAAREPAGAKVKRALPLHGYPARGMHSSNQQRPYTAKQRKRCKISSKVVCRKDATNEPYRIEHPDHQHRGKNRRAAACTRKRQHPAGTGKAVYTV